MDNSKYLLTKQGLKDVKAELHDRLTIQRKLIADKIELAAAEGDLSENAAYSAALEEQGMNEAKILELTDIVSNAIVSDDIKSGKNRVIDLGESFEAKNLKTGKTANYKLVGEGESDPLSNKISITSPVGSAVMHKKAGDEVEVKTPNGIIKYKILSLG